MAKKPKPKQKHIHVAVCDLIKEEINSALHLALTE